LGNWLKHNFVNILFVAGLALLIAYALQGMTPEEAWGSLKAGALVVLGLSFLIFIHELGHFAAAKACGVKVETFSIGFGRPIPGCHFRYGETYYKLGMIPVGGYVKMLGENPGEEPAKGEGEQAAGEAAQAAADDPRSYRNKPVGQRMIIISAGVIMNVLFGFLAFLYVYAVPGKTEVEARVGYIEPGSPADRAGLRAGSEILTLNGAPVRSYEDIFYTTALSTPGKTELALTWRTPDGAKHEGVIIPRKLPTDPKPLIGVGFPYGLVLAGEENGRTPSTPHSPAAQADVRGGDRFLGVRPKGAAEFRPLTNGWDYSQAEYDFRGQEIEIQVQRGGQIVVVTVAPWYFHTLGVHMTMGKVVSIGKDAPEPVKQIQPGDVITAFNGRADFDPLRLPDLVMDAAARGEPIRLTVRRGGQPIEVTVDPAVARGRGTWNEEHPNNLLTPVSIPALGLVYEVENTVARVEPGTPADGQLQPGDRVLGAKVTTRVGAEKHQLAGSGADPDELTSWPFLFWRIQMLENKEVELTVQRGEAAPFTLTLTARPQGPGTADPWPLPDRGFALELETKKVHGENFLDSASLAFTETYRTIGRIYMHLKGLVTGALSKRFLSGPIDIVKKTYAVAERDFSYYVWFVAMISINLAVVNFLPIPVLDGGHMVFLILEKIRGKPTDERMQAIATAVGLALILGLFAFVIFLDISRMEWVQRMFG
jgi:regulator of sigma E protease